MAIPAGGFLPVAASSSPLLVPLPEPFSATYVLGAPAPYSIPGLPGSVLLVQEGDATADAVVGGDGGGGATVTLTQTGVYGGALVDFLRLDPLPCSFTRLVAEAEELTGVPAAQVTTRRVLASRLVQTRSRLLSRIGRAWGGLDTVQSVLVPAAVVPVPGHGMIFGVEAWTPAGEYRPVTLAPDRDVPMRLAPSATVKDGALHLHNWPAGWAAFDALRVTHVAVPSLADLDDFSVLYSHPLLAQLVCRRLMLALATLLAERAQTSPASYVAEATQVERDLLDLVTANRRSHIGEERK